MLNTCINTYILTSYSSLCAVHVGGMQAQLYGSSVLAGDLFQLNVTPIVNASLLFSAVMALFPAAKRKVERLHQDQGREVSTCLACSCSAAPVQELQPDTGVAATPANTMVVL